MKWLNRFRPKPRPQWGLCPVQMGNVTIYVTPDYFVEDGIRMPVGMTRALAIAEARDMLLPTKDMVDAIWAAADIKLPPLTIPWDDANTTLRVFQRHNLLIEDQLAGKEITGKLIAGHKKDIVVSNRGGRVAIYGWHRTSGRPIQPYSTVHGWDYHDYSHGLRLVSKLATRNGKTVRLEY